MSMEMKFNSQICTTREQSERLIALGLKKETADCHWAYHSVTATRYVVAHPCDGVGECIPAWSLHRLIEMMPVSLPCEIEGIQGLFSLTRRDDGSVTVGYTWSLERTGNIYDAMISAIEWLIKNEDFSNEYVA